MVSADCENGGGELRLAEVMAGLSLALDMAEGQPAGHAARTCMIGMRLAREIYLLPRQRLGLFYALLLKDLGCSSNAARFCGWLGADDLRAKNNWKTANWSGMYGKLEYIFRNASPGANMASRVARFMKASRAGSAAARELMAMRSDWGSQVARQLKMPEETVAAIRNVDEHWDGLGHPRGLAGEDIPMLARIVGLSQTVEAFYRRDGLEGAMAKAKERSGKWFDPELVKALVAVRRDVAFWEKLHAADLGSEVLAISPDAASLKDGSHLADEDTLDRMAAGFGRVIDAKSVWTARHSVGVSEVAVGMATAMGIDGREVRLIRRAALLHDIGKLGISNLILDKPGKLDAGEMIEMRRHAYYTRQMLGRMRGFSEIAEMAAGHHERMDGGGYDRGLEAKHLATGTRILAVADMFEALAARRPYRQDLTGEEVMGILEKNIGAGVDGECVEGLRTFLGASQYEVAPVAA